jgi:ribosome-binding ATPase YchF (GTP1/OBG family)
VGVSFFESVCPCVQFKKQAECSPRYGSCLNGTRRIPVKVLDVAGVRETGGFFFFFSAKAIHKKRQLVPGASEGLGLGNKFLDDLRGADVLLHVIDASGTTNERGEKTINYDPSNDAEWLRKEIEDWVYNNIFPRWANIARRHAATKRSVVVTLQAQLGGYGARKSLTARLCAKLGLVDPVDLAAWDKDRVRSFVRSDKRM